MAGFLRIGGTYGPSAGVNVQSNYIQVSSTFSRAPIGLKLTVGRVRELIDTIDALTESIYFRWFRHSFSNLRVCRICRIQKLKEKGVIQDRNALEYL